MRIAIILTLYIVQVSGQDETQVSAAEGENALLHCNYNKTDLPSQPTVIWTDPDERNVFMLSKGKPDYIEGKVGIFPNQYSSGNFSIQLLKVTKQQNGSYKCSINEVDYRVRINLYVTDRAVKIEGGPQGGAPVPRISWFPLVMLYVAVLFI